MLDLNIVPVVMGGGNYSRDAPENSVINVKDFPSAKALVDYLTYLTRNPVSDITDDYIQLTFLNTTQVFLLMQWSLTKIIKPRTSKLHRLMSVRRNFYNLYFFQPVTSQH